MHDGSHKPEWQIYFQAKEDNSRGVHYLAYVIKHAIMKLKPSQNKKGRKKFLAAPFLNLFLQLVAEKKD